ncbi:MAG: hypothetical protein B7X31_07370 [Thiomonas sp. 13-66-29]|jgi:hypothetical protein|nr:MAG: hypothetical protein B7X31_07370 [Thiomonas sp. 13-66-29]
MARTRQVAKNEMALGLMSVFRPLPDGAQRHEVIIEQKFAGGQVRVHGVEMNVFEQGIFLSVLALAGDGLMQTAKEAGLLPTLPDNSNPNAPRNAKPEDNSAAQGQCVRVNTSIAELCRMAGLADAPGGGTRAAIKTAFSRLAMLTVFAQDERGKWGITHLIGGGMGDDPGGKVSAWLNPRSTRAVLGERAYAPVSMQVWRQLPTPPAKALYAWLCAWFAGGTGTRQISMDALEIHVFGALAKSKQTRSDRRKEIRVALTAIEGSTAGEIVVTPATSGGKNVTITRQWTTPNVPLQGEIRTTPSAGLDAEVRPAPDCDTPRAGPHQNGESSASQYPCVFHDIGQCFTGAVQVAATSSSSAVLRADRLHCSENHQTTAPNPPLPGLVTAACPAPAGALALGRQHGGDQASVAGNGTVAGDEKNRPHMVAGSIRCRSTMRNSLLTGLIDRSAASVSQTTQNPAKGDSGALVGQSCVGGTHG